MKQVEKSFFTTQVLPPGERVAVWKESISSLFDVEISSAMPEEAFNANLSSFLLDEQIMLSQCETRGQRFERSSLRIAGDGLDHYLIQTHLKGSQTVQHGSKVLDCETGDLLVIDLAERHVADVSDFSHLTLVVPRPLLAPLLRQPDSQGSRVVKGNKALSRLAVNHLITLSQLTTTLTAEEAEQTVFPTVSLIAGALNGSVDSVPDGAASVRAGWLSRVKLEIERNLQGNLDINLLCARLNISRAGLYRLFEPSGGVRAYIQERRLQRCVRELMSRQQAHRKIHDIAFSWGFGSEAHFSRAFRHKFGFSPTEARQKILSLQGHENQAPLQLVDRNYETWLHERLKL